MTIVKHELRRGRTAFIIWTFVIALLLAACVYLFPDMKSEMDEINEVFSSMGTFTQAFGMDKLNFGTLVGYYAIECGNVLGLGGAFFAALLGCGILCKEERDKTAEYLFSHPISRGRVVTGKLVAVILQIVLMNIIIVVISAATMIAIGETIPWKELGMLHLAYLILQLEIAAICFGISAFLRKGSIGIGMGIAAILYFLNLISNITESAKVLKKITPFAYCDGAEIVNTLSLDCTKVITGAALGVFCIIVAYIKYTQKDMR